MIRCASCGREIGELETAMRSQLVRIADGQANTFIIGGDAEFFCMDCFSGDNTRRAMERIRDMNRPGIRAGASADAGGSAE